MTISVCQVIVHGRVLPISSWNGLADIPLVISLQTLVKKNGKETVYISGLS